MKKILVLMSGGVDSSTAATLLVREGHDVSGVYLKLWEPAQTVISTKRPEGARGEISHIATKDGVGSLDYASHALGSARDDGGRGLGDPCWAAEMRDAARVAARLRIPFQVWDVTEDYKKRVLENFYNEYAAGRTPNPDVLCNSEIKFGVALKRALAAGFDYVATGHYARIASSVERRALSDRLYAIRYTLYAGRDSAKDQSYFLWRLTQEQLARVLFPIGEYTKPQVRAIARRIGMHNWNKKDSQGVCFLGKIRLKDFLYSQYRHPERSAKHEVEGSRTNVRNSHAREIPRLAALARNDIVQDPGPIVDVHGNLLGFHDGLAHLTIGQRHGTRLGGTGPYFVIEKDMTRNTLVVVHESEEVKYRAVECKMQNVKCKIEYGLKCMARVRYRAPLTPVQYYHTSEYASIGRVVFDEPQRAVAPGQSMVFYDGERVIGGGIIQNVKLLNEVVILNSPKLQFTNSPNKRSNSKYLNI